MCTACTTAYALTITPTSTQGLSERRLHSAGELERLLQSAEGHRVVAATAMNAESSRSHTVRHALTALVYGICCRSAASALGALCPPPLGTRSARAAAQPPPSLPPPSPPPPATAYNRLQPPAGAHLLAHAAGRGGTRQGRHLARIAGRLGWLGAREGRGRRRAAPAGEHRHQPVAHDAGACHLDTRGEGHARRTRAVPQLEAHPPAQGLARRHRAGRHALHGLALAHAGKPPPCPNPPPCPPAEREVRPSVARLSAAFSLLAATPYHSFVSHLGRSPRHSTRYTSPRARARSSTRPPRTSPSSGAPPQRPTAAAAAAAAAERWATPRAMGAMGARGKAGVLGPAARPAPLRPRPSDDHHHPPSRKAAAAAAVATRGGTR